VYGGGDKIPPTEKETLLLERHRRHQLDVNDEELDNKENPRFVDELLTKELMRLSVNDRNGIQEEIHGVGCLAPEEHPQFVESSLKALSIELDALSLSLPPDLTKAYRQSQLLTNTYVNEAEFRLRFLRCELFDVPLTALRICGFLELVLDLFGEYALQRPITLYDFNKEELKYLRYGCYQFLPFRDRAGRRIVSIIPGEGLESVPVNTKAKIALYTSWAAGCNDVDTQRKGIVFLVWFDKTIKTQKIAPKQRAKDHEVASVRASAIHCCTPDSPMYRFRRSIMAMRIASHNRFKLKVHLGDAMENRYTLQTYGIPSDQIPITWSGTIKLTYHRQWIRLRQTIEQRELGQRLSGTPPEAFIELNKSTMIECPNLNDVLFRQGTSTTSHPGNVAFRVMIERRLRELERAQQLEYEKKENGRSKKKTKSRPKITSIKTRKLSMDVIEELRQKQNNRILFWNEMGWWDVAKDEKQIYLKVEYIVREFRLSLKRMKTTGPEGGDEDGNEEEDVEVQRSRVRARARPQLTMPSLSKSSLSLRSPSPHLIRSEDEKQDDDSMSSIPAFPSPAPSIVRVKEERQDDRVLSCSAFCAPSSGAIHLKGGTSIFLETQDCGVMGPISRNKRQRCQNLMFDNDGDDQVTAECFGMKFIQC